MPPAHLIVAALLITAPLQPVAGQTPPLAASASVADIERKISEDCAAGRFSGIAVAVHQGVTVLKKTCGSADAETKAPITEATRYKIFSMSKPFTGSAVMKLVERGRVDLDAPIRRYIKEVPVEWQAVTVRHLLNHLSGIPDLTNDLLDPYLKIGLTSHDAAMKHVLTSKAAQVPPKTYPGLNWAYNNFGYELLATLIERVSGESSARFIERNIFKPARMTSASVELPLVQKGGVKRARPSPGLAQGYNGEPGKLKPANSYSFVQQGAGALHMAYGDLLAFNKALTSGKILSPRTQALSRSEAFPIRAGTGYGLGWLTRHVSGKPYLQHSGGTNGFATDFARTPDGRTAVIIMSNLGFANAEDYRKSLMEALLSQP